METKAKIHLELVQAYANANPTKSKQTWQKEINERWNGIKNDKDWQNKASDMLKDLKAVAMIRKGSLLNFWATKQPRTSIVNITENVDQVEPALLNQYQSNVNHFDHGAAIVDSNSNSKNTSSSTSGDVEINSKAKVQMEIKLQIDVLNSDLVGLYNRQSLGLLNDQQEKDFKEKKKKKTELQLLLKKKKNDQLRQKKSREDRKIVLEKAFEKKIQN